MAQGVLPFKYEAEKNDTGMTSQLFCLDNGNRFSYVAVM